MVSMEELEARLATHRADIEEHFEGRLEKCIAELDRHSRLLNELAKFDEIAPNTLHVAEDDEEEERLRKRLSALETGSSTGRRFMGSNEAMIAEKHARLQAQVRAFVLGQAATQEAIKQSRDEINDDIANLQKYVAALLGHVESLQATQAAGQSDENAENIALINESRSPKAIQPGGDENSREIWDVNLPVPEDGATPATPRQLLCMAATKGVRFDRSVDFFSPPSSKRLELEQIFGRLSDVPTASQGLREHHCAPLDAVQLCSVGRCASTSTRAGDDTGNNLQSQPSSSAELPEQDIPPSSASSSQVRQDSTTVARSTSSLTSGRTTVARSQSNISVVTSRSSISSASSSTFNALQSPQMQDAMRKQVAYQFQESVWDASILMGHRIIEPAQHVMLTSGVLINAFIQVSICSILAFHIAVDKWDPDDTASDYGRKIESLKYLNGTDLAAECEEDELLQIVAGYTDRFLGQLQLGQVLCMIIVFLWALHMIKVLRLSGEMLLSMRALYRRGLVGRRTKIRLKTGGGGQFEMTTISWLRFIWATLGGLLQMGIAAWLMVFGSLWLIYTKELDELMLNGVALTFVTEFDELIYDVIVPRRVKSILTNLSGVPLSSKDPFMRSDTFLEHVKRSWPLRPMWSTCSVMIFIALMTFQVIQPHTDKMLAATKQYC